MANIGYMQLTRLCNQKCRFCSNPEREETITIKDASSQIDEFASLGYQGIILTGGEPTLHPKLASIIRYARKKGLESRIITNGQITADASYMRSLYSAGLRLMHVSIHSCRPKVQAALTENRDSLPNILRTLKNAEKLGINVIINTVINAYNSDHLDENAQWIVSHFPRVKHFVWNYIDPTMNRASQNPDTLPNLVDMELPLLRAMRFLDQGGRTFRVERVPLCFMTEFAHCSTETRKIVKGEERYVRFLDERGVVRQTQFEYGKKEMCLQCFLCGICAGLYEMDTYYSPEPLHAVFVDREAIVAKIMGE